MKASSQVILNHRRKISEYSAHANKRPYYDAVASGDVALVVELSTMNYEYPSQLFASSENYSDAMNRYYHEAVCCAAELCLVAIQNGLPDMIAYDIRDEFIDEFDRAISLPDLYDLIHGMTHEFAMRVRLAKNSKIGSPRLAKMMSYVEEHLYEDFSLQDVAKAADVSRTYASSVFKKECGVSLSDFIVQERINEAKRLLAADKMSISEIAEQLQFCSQSYFGECFKRVTGMTAGEYKRTNV